MQGFYVLDTTYPEGGYYVSIPLTLYVQFPILEDICLLVTVGSLTLMKRASQMYPALSGAVLKVVRLSSVKACSLLGIID
jgi:hypothetical protein